MHSSNRKRSLVLAAMAEGGVGRKVVADEVKWDDDEEEDVDGEYEEEGCAEPSEREGADLWGGGEIEGEDARREKGEAGKGLERVTVCVARAEDDDEERTGEAMSSLAAAHVRGRGSSGFRLEIACI